jgi:hypothetical protein
MIIKEMFHIPIKLKPELTRASMMTSDVNNQWRSSFLFFPLQVLQDLKKKKNHLKI